MINLETMNTTVLILTSFIIITMNQNESKYALDILTYLMRAHLLKRLLKSADVVPK